MGRKDKSGDNAVKYNIYLGERKSLIENKNESSRSFDKAILTLAAGAFGLSLTFLNRKGIIIRHETWCLLISSWVFLCLSILSTLVSFLTSQYAFSRSIKILEIMYFSDIDHDKPNNLRNRPAEITKWFNIISIFTFIVGVILLASFSSINIGS